MFSRILIPVDALDPAERAVAVGDRLASAAGGTIKIVHVVHPCASFIAHAPTEVPAAKDAERIMARLGPRISPNVSADCEILCGVPAEQIVALARTWDADLIIVGDRNRRVVSRFFLGSVADAVVRHAPCSVLVVREKKLHPPATDGADAAG